MLASFPKDTQPPIIILKALRNNRICFSLQEKESVVFKFGNHFVKILLKLIRSSNSLFEQRSQKFWPTTTISQAVNLTGGSHSACALAKKGKLKNQE